MRNGHCIRKPWQRSRRLSFKPKRLVVKILILFCLGFSILGKAAGSAQNPEGNVNSAAHRASETQRLNQWLDARYEEYLSRHPVWMTVLEGRKDRYDQIDDFSEAAEREELRWRAKTVDDLKSTFRYSDLSDEARISHDLWIYQYEIAALLAPFLRHHYIFNQMDGAQSQLPGFLINFHTVDDESDMVAYVSRISGISRAMLQLLDRAKAAASEGIRPPRFAYQVAIEEAQAQLDGAPFRDDVNVRSPLWEDASQKIDRLQVDNLISEQTAAELQSASRRALIEHFFPAYRKVITWLEADIENCKEEPEGVGALPNGKAYYETMLEYRTTSSLSPAEVHAIGLKEVGRIRNEMEAIKNQVGFEGSLEEFFKFVRSSGRFYFDNNDNGRQKYIRESELALKSIQEKLPQYFGQLPESQLIVKRVEPFREQDGGPAFYYGGTPDGSRPGIYYLHLSDMTTLNTTSLESIAYHEGYPGHHMERSISLALEGIPLFRAQAHFNSYVEGWALYAESLAKEMGAFEDPYSDFGRLTEEMWRAIRLVVDTGIHAEGWTEAQAVTFALDNSAVPETKAVSEVRRYFVWPGQAASYKIGMLEIQRLRSDAEKVLAGAFDLGEFHDTLLGGGPLPGPLLRKRVNHWLEQF